MTAEQYAEREEIIRQIAAKHDASMTPEAKRKRALRIRRGGEATSFVLPQAETEKNIKSFLTPAAIMGEVPVSSGEVVETLKEDTEAFREEQKDAETASEALTADEKV